MTKLGLRWHWSEDENGERMARIIPALGTPLYEQHINAAYDKARADQAANGRPQASRRNLWRKDD